MAQSLVFLLNVTQMFAILKQTNFGKFILHYITFDIMEIPIEMNEPPRTHL